MSRSNEVPPYLLDQITVVIHNLEKTLDKFHKRLDEIDEQQHAYHEQPSYWPVTTAALQPPFTYTDPYRQSQPYTDPYSQPQYYIDPYTQLSPAPPSPSTGWPPTPPQHSSCWSPTNHYHQGVYCHEQPTDLHQHHSYEHEHYQHHQCQQQVQPMDAYWQQQHQYQEHVIDQQPPLQLPSPCSSDIRYGSLELLADDKDDLLNSGHNRYNDTNTKITSQRVECYKSSFSLCHVESSSELIVKESVSEISGNGSDYKWKYADNTGEQSKVGISHRIATLDFDARLIPPRDDTQCAVTEGYKCLLNRGSLKRKCETTLDEESEEPELDLTKSGVVTTYKAIAATGHAVLQLVLPERGVTSPTRSLVTGTVGETSLGNTASLSLGQLSAKQGARAFDPGGSNLQYFAWDWKKIEASMGSKITKINAQKYFLEVQQRGIHGYLPPPWPRRKAAHPYPQRTFKIASVLSQESPYFQGLAVVADSRFARMGTDEELRFSFKLRGTYNMMAQLSTDKLKKGVISSSTSEYAQGRKLSAQKWECNDVMAAAQVFSLILPFEDHLDVFTGQGTVSMEIMQRMRGSMETIFVFVGGGERIAVVANCVHWVLPDVKIIGVESFDANAMLVSLHLDRGVELNQVGGVVAKGTVMELDEEIFHLCSKELTEGMRLVSHSAICASIKNMFEEIWSILRLPLIGGETYCKYYGLKGANVVAVISGDGLKFSGLRPTDVVQLYWQLSSLGIELLEVFHGSQISELDCLLVSWFPP